MKYWKLQDDIMALSVGNKLKSTKQEIPSGSQHTAKTNTIAMDVFNTYRSLFTRRSLALTDCSPGIFWDLTFKRMMR